ncbi:MAG: tRNA uracil 4-sulfurtransferase ThiI [Gammaproteobacteria bacterium]
MKFLIKYSPEMTTKSRIVRTRFCRQLRKNLARLLRMHVGLVDRAADAHAPDAISVTAHWDYLDVDIPPAHAALLPQVENVLRNTPGIWSFSRVQAHPLPDFDGILALVKAQHAEALRGKSFAVRCRRAGKHAFRSMDVDRFVGAGLLRDTDAARVNLTNPDVTVALEIRDDELFLVEASQDGIGGFPIGTTDSVVSLISGGFDSAVATFLSMKRGLRTHYLFFNLGGREHEIAVKEVALYLWLKFGASHHVQFITVPFEGVVAEILEKIENSQMGVILKRMMLRAAERVARYLEVEALVTGESIAQVSSQTLQNLAVIDEVTNMLVLRPLAMSDKQDIVDLARKIGTEEFSAVIPEYCGVISVKPTTRAKRHRIEHEESRFDFAILEKALAERVALDIRDMRMEELQPTPLIEEVQAPPAGAVIIDIRHPDEAELQPLGIHGNTVLALPFYRLNRAFAELDQDKTYLLYCAKGVMSRLHASHLKESGFLNVGVYRP